VLRCPGWKPVVGSSRRNRRSVSLLQVRQHFTDDFARSLRSSSTQQTRPVFQLNITQLAEKNRQALYQSNFSVDRLPLEASDCVVDLKDVE